MGRPSQKPEVCDCCGGTRIGCRRVGDFNICADCAPQFKERSDEHFSRVRKGEALPPFKHTMLSSPDDYLQMGFEAGDRSVEDGDILAAIADSGKWIPKCFYLLYAQGYIEAYEMEQDQARAEIEKLKEAAK